MLSTMSVLSAAPPMPTVVSVIRPVFPERRGRCGVGRLRWARPHAPLPAPDPDGAGDALSADRAGRAGRGGRTGPRATGCISQPKSPEPAARGQLGRLTRRRERPHVPRRIGGGQGERRALPADPQRAQCLPLVHHLGLRTPHGPGRRARVQRHMRGEVAAAVRHRPHLAPLPEAGQRAERRPRTPYVGVVDGDREPRGQRARRPAPTPRRGAGRSPRGSARLAGRRPPARAATPRPRRPPARPAAPRRPRPDEDVPARHAVRVRLGDRRRARCPATRWRTAAR